MQKNLTLDNELLIVYFAYFIHKNINTMTNNKRTPFNKSFYVANTMEIFERLAWYGFFTLSSLYMTSPIAQGGLGFTDQERGFLQGMIPFLLYLFPVITGALADRYGYKKMFVISFCIMAPSYYLLGQATDFWSFCFTFLAVAIGAACFKPIVVGTVARVTDDTNRGLGFGVFYTMVNLGGFIGPLIAGYMRVIGWDMVFVMSAIWITINFIPVIFFYKDPVEKPAGKSLKQVFAEAQQVLGNGRLALLVLPLLLGLMITAKGVFSYQEFLICAVMWLILNFCWSKLFTQHNHPSWYKQSIEVGNKPFVIYLLILSGFWTMYLQLFITTPLFIRDFVDTRDLVSFLSVYTPSFVDFLAAVNPEQLTTTITSLTQTKNMLTTDYLNESYFTLVNYKVMVPLNEIQIGLQAVQEKHLTAAQLATNWITKYRQVNPEYIINLDFGMIVFLQIFISSFCSKLKALPVIIIGTLVVAFGYLIGGMAHGIVLGGTMIVTSVVVFAVGEMIASPKSQEYVAAIAPKDNTAMYMGYYFVSMALGNLFAGLLSGTSYAYFAKTLHQPMLMWIIFAAIGIVTAIALFVFNHFMLRQQSEDLTTPVTA